MTLIHHLFGAAWAFLATSAIATGVAGIWLKHRLAHLEHPRDFDRRSIYAALVLPGLVPFAWAVSSSVHAVMTDQELACCAWLVQSPVGWQHVVFGLVPLALFGAQAWACLRRWRAGHGQHVSPGDESVHRRLRQVIREDELLSDYERQIRLVDCERGIFAARGSRLVQSRVEVSARLVDELDDGALRAALHHEIAHLRNRDPWRFTMLAVASVLNPFSRWLQGAASAWRFSREISCDRQATRQGAEPLALADALVTVARQMGSATDCRETHRDLASASLCGADERRLTTRIKMLMERSTGTYETDRSDTLRETYLVGLGLLSILIPHLLGGSFAFLHCIVEWPVM